MNGKYSTVIESIGIYLPPKVVSTRDVLLGCKNEVSFPLEKMSGIQSRRVAGEGEYSIDLAIKAVEDCLSGSKYLPTHVELLICCNISRADGPNQFSAEPGTSVKLKQHFGFDNAVVMDIANACPGLWTGINIVDTFIKMGFIRCGMVASGEYISHLIQTAQQEITGFLDSRLACLTLGDAGAAVILDCSPEAEIGLKNIDIQTLGEYSSYCIAKPTREEHGGAIMYTDSIQLNAAALKYQIMHTEQSRRMVGWQPESIQHLIPHQVSKIAIDDARRQINGFYGKDILHEGNFVNNLANRGNTATTSHFVALKEYILRNNVQAGDNMAFCITGSGLTIGTAFYKFDDLPERIRQMEVNGQQPQKEPILPGRPSSLPSLSGVRIESIGTFEHGHEIKRDSIDLAKAAAERCLEKSSYNPGDIELLIFTGVYRSEGIFEPALATMIAGELEINNLFDPDEHKKTLAFDVCNGAIGFVNACYIASRMIQGKKYKNAMIVASEVENVARHFPNQFFDLKETGSALILDEATVENMGFGDFVFQYFTDYLNAKQVTYDLSGKIPHLDIYKDPALNNYYIESIFDVAQNVLERNGLEMRQIKAIFPPQISGPFIMKLANRLGVNQEKMIDVVGSNQDLFTSSLPYALQSAKDHKTVKEGDIGLLISVGSGVQVGCAIYRF